MSARLKYLSILRPSICRIDKSSPNKERIRRCIVDWILYREYWDNEDNIDTFSSKNGIPREEITSFLYEHTGGRYLSIRKELRIDDAKDLIRERPDLSVYQIARMVGICDKSNFRKDFTELVGYRPKLWRECGGKRWKCFIASQDKGRSRCPSPHRTA